MPPREFHVGTNEALKTALDEHGLATWRSEIDAVPTRDHRALTEAAGRLPEGNPDTFKYVRVRRGTLGDTEAVRE